MPLKPYVVEQFFFLVYVILSIDLWLQQMKSISIIFFNKKYNHKQKCMQ